MKKSIGFTVFLIILFIVLLAGRIVAGYYSEAVPFLKELAKTLTWVCVINGILALAFIVVIFIKTIIGGKEE